MQCMAQDKGTPNSSIELNCGEEDTFKSRRQQLRSVGGRTSCGSRGLGATWPQRRTLGLMWTAGCSCVVVDAVLPNRSPDRLPPGNREIGDLRSISRPSRVINAK
jgi:hypothetical protein